MFPKHKALSIKKREVVPRERRPLPSHKVVVSRACSSEPDDKSLSSRSQSSSFRGWQSVLAL